MKIDRLIGIITLLLQKEKLTIPLLAKRFEVSGRTIQRDIDAICQAGIPVVTVQGYGGGLSLAEGYRLDKTVLTTGELRAVLAGLKSLDSVQKTTYRQTLLEKLGGGAKAVPLRRDIMLIDLASWYKDSIQDKIAQIEQAILGQHVLTFTYYSARGEARRSIEPYYIVYQWAAWYVLGYCLSRQEFRLFKLNRMWETRPDSRTFALRELPESAFMFNRFVEEAKIEVTALFDPCVKHRLIEEYGPDSFTAEKDGRLLFRRAFATSAYALQWLLSFGDTVQVLAPASLAANIQTQARHMADYYQ